MRREQRPDPRAVLSEEGQRHHSVDDPADADEDDDDEREGRRGDSEVRERDHAGDDVDEAQHDVATRAHPPLTLEKMPRPM